MSRFKNQLDSWVLLLSTQKCIQIYKLQFVNQIQNHNRNKYFTNLFNTFFCGSDKLDSWVSLPRKTHYFCTIKKIVTLKRVEFFLFFSDTKLHSFFLVTFFYTLSFSFLISHFSPVQIFFICLKWKFTSITPTSSHQRFTHRERNKSSKIERESEIQMEREREGLKSSPSDV